MDRWEPPVELTKKEQLIMKRLNRVRPLFGFLRLNRHVLFDDTFQEQLEDGARGGYMPPRAARRSGRPARRRGPAEGRPVEGMLGATEDPRPGCRATSQRCARSDRTPPATGGRSAA